MSRTIAVRARGLLACFIVVACNVLFGPSASAQPTAAQPTAALPTAALRVAGRETRLRGFIENKGQIADREGLPRPDVRFIAGARGGNVQLRATGFSTELIDRTINAPMISEARGTRVRDGREADDAPKPGDVTEHVHRIDVEFDGANPAPRIVAAEPSGDYDNYFLPHTPCEGILGVRAYATVTYRDLYPGIDAVFRRHSGTASGFSCDFIVHPGADVRQIRLQYAGSDGLRLTEDGVLRIANTAGLLEQRMTARMLDGDASDGAAASRAREAVDLRLVLEEHRLSFDVPRSLRRGAFVVTLWGTYYGGSARDAFEDMDVDRDGNICCVGTTESTNAIVTAGAYQSTWSGARTAFAVKFDANGTRQWGTYYQPVQYSDGWGIACDATGNVGICGLTHQLAIPHTFIAVFSPTGSYRWSVYTGPHIEAYGIAADGSGNFAVAGRTLSNTDISTPNAYQTSRHQAYDYFLMTYSATGVKLWGTYFGGNQSDERRPRVTCDLSGNFILYGETYSWSGIASPGAYQATIAGSSDAFLAKFSNDGTFQWATYYGGSAPDYPQKCTTDPGGNILLSGYTTSDDGIVPLGMARLMYQPVRHGSYDAYVALFTPGGMLTWASYYGGSESDFGYDVARDDSGNVILCGRTESPDGIATPNAHRDTFLGYSDGFLASFDANGTLYWGSYAGGEDGESAAAIAGYPNNEVLIAGYTSSATGIATSGAHQETLGGGSDGLLVKLGYVRQLAPCALNTGPVFGPFCPGDTVDVPFYALCSFQPGNVFTALLSDWRGSFSAPVVVGSMPGTDAGVIRCIIPRNMPPGSRYHIKVVSSAPALPAWASAAWFDITELPKVSIQGPAFACSGDSVLFQSTTTDASRYQWYRDGVAIPGATTATYFAVGLSGRYTLLVWNSAGCREESNPIDLAVDPPILIDAGDGKVICRGDSIRIGGIATGGTGPLSYVWFPPGGLDRADVAQPLAFPWKTTVYIVTVQDGVGCRAVDQVTVEVNPVPSMILPDEIQTCRGGSVVIGNPAHDGIPPYTYLWSPARGLNSTTVAQPTARPDTTMVYHVRVTDARGCSIEDSVRVSLVSTTGWLDAHDTAVCRGGTVALRVDVLAGTAPYRYHWSPGARVSDSTATSPTAVIDTARRFIVTVTDANGCVAVDTITVGTLPPLQAWIHAGGPTRFCEGDSVTLEIAGAWTSVRWSTGETSPGITVRKQGTYWAAITSSGGCTGWSDTVAVTVNPSPSPGILGPASTCVNGRAAYQARDSAGRHYTWRVTGGTIIAGGTGRQITVRWNTAGTGRIELTETIDSSGCSAAGSSDVQVGTVLKPLVSASGPLTICEGDSVMLDAGPGYATYHWNTGATTRTVVLRASGVAQVSVTDSAGCSGASDSVRVTMQQRPLPVLNGPRAVCHGDTVEYRITPAPGYTCLWAAEHGAITSGAGTERVVVAWDTAGAASIAITERDTLSGCEGSARLDVTVHPVPAPPVPSGPFALCDDDSLTLDAGAGYARYRWNTGDTTRRIMVKKTGNYSVAVTSAAGCTGGSAPVQVTATQIGAARIAGPQSACLGSRSRYSVGSIGAAAYCWIVTGGAIEGDSTAEQLTVRWTTNGSARVQVVASIGPCSSSDTIDVVIGASLTPSITGSGPTSFCRGDSVTLDAGGGYATYEWSDGGTVLSSLRIISVKNGGTYTVRVSDSGGCTGRSSVIVTVHPLPAPVIAGPSAFCEGDSATLQTTESYAGYVWKDEKDVVLADQNSVTLHAGGRYSVTVTDANGCTGASIPHTVTMHPRPAQPVITQSGDTLTCSPAAGYQWYFGSSLLPGAAARTLVATQNGFYAVRITDANGCEAQSPPFPFTRADGATATVALPVLEAAPGERVRIPISLTASQRLQQAGATEFRATIRFDGTILVPAGTTPLGSMDGGDRVITIRNASGIFENPLAELDLLAMLGPVDRTVLHVDSCSFGSAPVRVTRIDGEFRLKICREGGDRLFESRGRFGIGQIHPNPFNAMTTIDYEVIETGPAHLIVMDMLGREVATLVNALVEPGRYRVVLDATTLASGLYAAVLSTPSQTAYRMMRLVK